MRERIDKVLIIYGPTATGKTALAISLANKFQGELISADSRQVYSSLDIGTGKVSFDSKIEKHPGFWIVDGVRVNGFDLASPGETFTASDFIRFAQSSIANINKEKKLPIIVGGTGFYIQALIEGLGTQGIPANQPLREKLEKLNRADLYQHLIKINPSKAKSMNQSDRLNPRRLVRAIEVSQSTIRELISHKFEINNLTIGLTAPNAYLFENADKSFESRLKLGMIEEIKNLLSEGVNINWLDSLGLEYRWLTKFTLGQIPEEEALKQCVGDLHSFIRRQKTWFKKLKNINVYDISSPSWADQLEKKVELWYTEPTNVRK